MVARVLLAGLAFAHLFSPLGLPQAKAQESIVDTYPYVVLCSVGDRTYLGYLDRVLDNGDAVYIAPSGPAGTFEKGGVLKMPTEAASSSCDGKTLDELVSEGQAFMLMGN